MVFGSVHAKSTHHAPLLLRDTFPTKVFLHNFSYFGLVCDEDWKISQIRISNRFGSTLSPSIKHRSLTVKSMAKKNHENPSSDGGDWVVGGGGDPKENNSGGKNFGDTDSSNPKPIISDWREVRATLFRQEQAEKADPNPAHKIGPTPLGVKWAHPITVPEMGCVLVATEKLDGVNPFERSVVLLLGPGTHHPFDGPFGIVLNRPLPKKMKQMKDTNADLATVFGDCRLHFGGPLEASMFLVNTGKETRRPWDLDEVFPGLCFGARNRLDEAIGLVKKGAIKANDVRFFIGYAGWQAGQLMEEIELGYWFVVSCSSDLICEGLASDSASSDGLWNEILQLMGGRYSELSRKLRNDM